MKVWNLKRFELPQGWVEIFCVIAILMAPGCTSAPRASAPSLVGQPPGAAPSSAPHSIGSGPEFVGPPAPYGPMPTTPQEVYGPEPILLRPAVLVLGPGWARGFAHAGVLQALDEARIPIAGIIATEMGSIMAVLYGTSHSLNDFQWALLRLKPELFSREGKLLSGLFKGPSDGHDLEDALDQILGTKELGDSRFPIKLLMQTAGSKGELQLLETGKASAAVRASVAVPGLMAPGTWRDHEYASAGGQRPFPVSEAKLIAPFPVIVVDVLDRPGAESAKLSKNPEARAYFKAAARASLQLGDEAELVIRPDLKGFDYLDFKRRTDIAFRGKKAVLEHLDQIKHLVGMP